MEKGENMHYIRGNFLFIMLLLQCIVLASMLLGIPIFRNIIVFFYFTFIPGFVLLKMLRLNGLDTLETVLFSIGLSLAFLILSGLLVNEFCSFLGVLRPFSFIPLTIVLNTFVFIEIISVWLKDKNVSLLKIKIFKPSPILLLIFSPIFLSILGAIWMNIFEDNILLMIMLVLIPLIFAVFVLSKESTSSRFYPLFLLIAALSLLYHSSLISNYIYAADIHIEYHVAKTVMNEEFWFSTNPFSGDVVYGRFYSMVSVSILPVLYSNLLNIDLAWVFKLIFPFLFSFVPLGLYQIWKNFFGKKIAFVSAFFFISFETFYTEMLGLNRQMIAEIFFVLLLLVILSNKIKRNSKILCFAILSFGLVTSHYGLSEVFIFFALLTFTILFFIQRRSGNITITMVILFFTIMFAWYIYTTESAVFDSILSFADYVRNRLQDFFNPMSREEFVLRGLGLESPRTVWNAISRAFAYATEVLIIIGFIGLVVKRTQFHLKAEYFTLTVIAMLLLAALIVVPGLADTMNMTRFYHILLFLLAPLCVIGAKTITELVLKHKREIATSFLLLIVLVPYFLFQTCFIFELVKSRSSSVPLSKYRMDDAYLMVSFAYINSWKASGALWLNAHINVRTADVYADKSAHELGSYGMLQYTRILSNTTETPPNGTIYLSYLNVIKGIIVTRSYFFNSSELSYITDINKIYDNGGSEIFSIPAN